MTIQENPENVEKTGGTEPLDADALTERGNGEADAENAASSENKTDDQAEEDTEMEVSEE